MQLGGAHTTGRTFNKAAHLGQLSQLLLSLSPLLVLRKELQAHQTVVCNHNLTRSKRGKVILIVNSLGATFFFVSTYYRKNGQSVKERKFNKKVMTNLPIPE